MDKSTSLESASQRTEQRDEQACVKVNAGTARRRGSKLSANREKKTGKIKGGFGYLGKQKFR